jgi:hypothetical protein
MIASENDKCDIDIENNFFEIFCDLIDDEQSLIVNDIGNIPYVLLRLELADRLSYNDYKINELFDMIDMKNYKNIHERNICIIVQYESIHK